MVPGLRGSRARAAVLLVLLALVLVFHVALAAGSAEAAYAAGKPSKHFSSVPTPTVSGTAAPGEQLTAAAQGWSPAPTSVRFQWTRDGKSIAGATNAVYTVANADRGAALGVTATATRSGYASSVASSKTVVVPAPGADVDLLAIVYNVVLHAALIGSMAAFAIVLFTRPMRVTGLERMRLVGALFLGAAVAVGAQASGLSFAAFTAGALGGARGLSAGAALVTAVLPAMAGLGLGYLLVALQRTNEKQALRVICFVGMLTFVAFIETYATITRTRGLFLNVAAVPNLAFAIGVIFMFVFFSGRENAAPKLVPTLQRLLARRGPVRQPGSAASPDPAPGRRRDPFKF